MARARPHFDSMDDASQTLKEINPANPPSPLDDVARAEIAALVTRQRRANGVLMKAINFVGGQVEDGLKMLPKGTRDQVDEVARVALRHSFDVAHKSRQGIGSNLKSRQGIGSNLGSERLHKIMGTLAGAVGGFGGLPTAIAE